MLKIKKTAFFILIISEKKLKQTQNEKYNTKKQPLFNFKKKIQKPIKRNSKQCRNALQNHDKDSLELNKNCIPLMMN